MKALIFAKGFEILKLLTVKMNHSKVGWIVSLLITFITFLVINAPVSYAQNELLFGQNHFYTIIFRGNGEAIVYSKIIVTNSSDAPMTQLSFEVPKVTPSELVVFQQKLSPQCIRYDYQTPERACLEYREPDYNSYYSYYYGYGDSRAEYQKVQFGQSGNLYNLTLPFAIEPYKSSAIIISYAAKGYVKESFGLYNFNFETLKVPSRISNIKVAVDVDTDLLLKGKKSEVNYQSSTDKGFVSLGLPSAISSPSLDRVVGQIGSYGPLVKEAKNLAPNESFLVKGEYATNWFRLYLNSIILTIILLSGIITGIFFVTKFLQKRNKQTPPANLPSDINYQSTSSVSGQTQNSTGIFNIFTILMGLLSVLLVITLTFVLKLLAESSLFRSFQYGTTDPTLMIIIGISIFVSVLLLYLMAIFGPAIFVASKKGWKALLVVIASELIWFLVLVILYLTLFGSGLTSNIFRYQPPVM